MKCSSQLHVGVRGNEKADKMAKESLLKGSIEMKVSISKAEVKSVIWERMNQRWQDRWDREEKGRHLYHIDKSVKTKRVRSGLRREDIIMTRLRIGHSGLNKTLKVIGKHEDGLCERCQVEESVQHVIMDCREYVRERERMRVRLRQLGMQEFTLRGILGTSKRAQIKVLLGFLRDTGVFDRI